MTPNQIAIELALETKHSIRRQRQAIQDRHVVAVWFIAFGFLWAVAILFVLGWLAVGQ